MARAERLLAKCDVGITYGVIYAISGCPLRHCKQLELPRIFEWNVMHHHLLVSSCIDIDGVLCRDPTEAENDDGAAYERFLDTVPAREVPEAPLGWLVTCRLEKYREQTEAWLNRHAIRYRELVMLDLPDKRITRMKKRC